MHQLLDRTVAAAFWTASVICLLSLNDAAYMWVGVERAFSVPLLLCCVIALAGLLRVRLMEALGASGLLILATLAAYVGIGILVSIATATDVRSDASWYLVRHLSSVLLILAAAVGGRVVWNSIGGECLFRRILAVMVVSCNVMLASPVLMRIYQEPPTDGAFRYFGSFSDPNEAALVACFTVALALSFMGAGRSRALAYGALAIGLTAAVRTFSRTTLVVLPLLAVGSLLVSRGAARRRLTGGLALVGIAGGAAAMSLDTNVLQALQLRRWETMASIFDTGSVDDVSLGGRLTLWRLALQMATESPVFGQGLGRLHSLDEAWYNRDGVLLGAHNQYLVLVGEAGFIPLVLFVAFLGTLLHQGLRGRRELPVLAAVSGWALVAAVFSLAFHGMLTQRACNFVIGLGCAAVAGRYQPQGVSTSIRHRVRTPSSGPALGRRPGRDRDRKDRFRL